MKCEKCGNEMLNGDKFCGKCGTKVQEKVVTENDKTSSRKIKIKFNNKIVIITIVILLVVGIGGTIYYNNTVINDKYLTEDYKKRFSSQFDNIEVEALDVEDINYKKFNKLVLEKVTLQKDNKEVSNVGLVLVNRKENAIEGFKINNNLIEIFNGVANNDRSKVKDITKLSAKYIQMVGTEIFQQRDSGDFKNLLKEYANIIGIKECKQYVKTEFAKQVGNSNLQYTLLFEKQTPYVKYIAFYESNTKYNSKYPFDEKTYNYLKSQYSYKKTIDTLEYLYGPAYKVVNEYNVYKINGNSTNDTEEFENTSKIDSYSSLDDAKKELDVEE